jgi:superfamily II DNA or RNA helicase
MVRLRSYQTDLVESIRSAYRQGIQRCLAVAPTGSGKTVVFSYIAQQSLARGSRTLILVHRQELLDQTSRTLTAFDVPHGVIAAGRSSDATERIQIASVQTMVRRLDRIAEPDLIVIDEAHHSIAGSWRKVIDRFPSARVLGVTATPQRLDGKGLGSVFDQMIMGPRVADLQRDGHLSAAKYYAPTTTDLSGVGNRAGDYDHAGLESVMDRPTITGDAVDHYARLAHGMPAIAFCVSIAHARNVAESFCRAGYDAATIDGTLSAQDRRDRVQMLGDGRLSVLTSCEIINEGFDVPVVGAAILLRPTQSLGLHLQQIGRVLRPAPGKTHAVILDHAGNLARHGRAEDDRDWSLQDRPKKKSGLGNASVAVRQCPECFCCHAPNEKSCPECGYEYEVQNREIEHVEGELVEFSGSRLTRQQEVWKARTFDDLLRIQKARGYKPGWARIVWGKKKNKT